MWPTRSRFPFLPARPTRFAASTEECLGPRKAEYDDLQRRSGVIEESYWLQHDPAQGDMLVVVSDSDPDAGTEVMANPQTDFDRWFRDQMIEIFGKDPAEDWGRNELLGTWKA